MSNVSPKSPGDGNRWVSYVLNDTVHVMLGDGSYKVVFAGDSTTVPGQPSIFCAEGSETYQAHVVFAVYFGDDSSHIEYARLDADNLVLDTIAASNTLSESLPCVSSGAPGHVFVTWQDGYAVRAASLSFDPASWTPPGSWTTSNIVGSGAYIRRPNSMETSCTLSGPQLPRVSTSCTTRHAM